MNSSCILLVTHNRDFFVKRWLEFYSNFPTKIPIIIAASGTQESYNEVLSLSKDLNLDITVYYIESDSFFHKVLKALELIKFDYVTVCADDDYVLPNSIYSAVNFLENNTDYVSVSGYCFLVESKYKNIKHLNGLLTKGFYSASYNQLPINQESALNRIEQHLVRFTTTIYNTYRTPDLYIIFKHMHNASKSFSETFAMELIGGVLTAAKGKVHILDQLYMIRQSDNPYALSRTVANKKKNNNTIEKFICSMQFTQLANIMNIGIKDITKQDLVINNDFLANALVMYAIRYLSLKKHKAFIRLTKELLSNDYDFKSLRYIIKAYITLISKGYMLHIKTNCYKKNKLRSIKSSDEFIQIASLICQNPLGIKTAKT